MSKFFLLKIIYIYVYFLLFKRIEINSTKRLSVSERKKKDLFSLYKHKTLRDERMNRICMYIKCVRQ